MELFLNKLFQSFVQIIVFSLLPFIWWLIINRRKDNFFQWIGFKKIISVKNNIQIYLLMIIGVIIFSVNGVFILYIMRDIPLATSEFSGLGFNGLPAAIIYAVFNTSLPEEILFRGFILKRLMNKIGHFVGNIIQSILFGCLHIILLINIIDVIKLIIILLFTSSIAFYIGYINEKRANGSIIPGWIMHGIANILSSVIALFLLI